MSILEQRDRITAQSEQFLRRKAVNEARMKAFDSLAPNRTHHQQGRERRTLGALSVFFKVCRFVGGWALVSGACFGLLRVVAFVLDFLTAAFNG